MKRKFKMPGAILIVSIPLILSGCGLWGNSQSQQADKPSKQDVKLVNPGDSLDMKQDKDHKGKISVNLNNENTKTVEVKLFLLDKHGLVVPQTFKLPAPNGLAVAKQALQGLVKDGTTSNMIPNGFEAVLPAGTEVLGTNLKGHTLIVDFSKEFKSYKPEDEKKILEAVTWTATQFNGVNHVKIRINGVNQHVMPVNKTVIGKDGASRADGINEETGNVVDVTGSQAVTLYFPAQAGDHYYYVPVTTRTDGDKSKITAAVNGLINGSTENSGLLNVFGSKVKLVSDPTIEDGVVTLNFNKAIYSNAKKKTISDEELNSLVLSLTAQDGIKKVAIQVDGNPSVKTEAGQVISKPVSRPKDVNTVGL